MTKAEHARAVERILVVDDEPRMINFIRMNLDLEGFNVYEAYDGKDALQKVREVIPDLVILDVMMPKLNGFETLALLRESSSVPVIMLTARGDEDDLVQGLELGADDYLPKTFSARELLARLRAVMRRSSSTASSTGGEEIDPEIINGQLHISPSSRTAALEDVPLKLTTLEYDLLLSLARACGRVKSREQILDDIAGRDYGVYDRSIDVHISALRQKLGDNPKDPTYIRTVRSIGYMMVKQ